MIYNYHLKIYGAKRYEKKRKNWDQQSDIEKQIHWLIKIEVAEADQAAGQRHAQNDGQRGYVDALPVRKAVRHDLVVPLEDEKQNGQEHRGRQKQNQRRTAQVWQPVASAHFR